MILGAKFHQIGKLITESRFYLHKIMDTANNKHLYQAFTVSFYR